VVTYGLLGSGGLPAVWVPMLYVFVLGTAAGAEYDALAYLTSRYFGARAYSAIYGTIFVGFAIGAGFAPYVFSMIVAWQHSYEMLLLWTAGVLVVGATGLLTLGGYPQFNRIAPARGEVAAVPSASTQ
jgi:hypothetical protein